MPATPADRPSGQPSDLSRATPARSSRHADRRGRPGVVPLLAGRGVRDRHERQRGRRLADLLTARRARPSPARPTRRRPRRALARTRRVMRSSSANTASSPPAASAHSNVRPTRRRRRRAPAPAHVDPGGDPAVEEQRRADRLDRGQGVGRSDHAVEHPARRGSTPRRRRHPARRRGGRPDHRARPSPPPARPAQATRSARSSQTIRAAHQRLVVRGGRTPTPGGSLTVLPSGAKRPGGGMSTVRTIHARPGRDRPADDLAGSRRLRRTGRAGTTASSPSTAPTSSTGTVLLSDRIIGTPSPRRGPRHRQLAVGVHHALARHRGDRQRQGTVAAEQRPRRIDRRHVDERAWHDPPAIERPTVLGPCLTQGRPVRDVGDHVGRQVGGHGSRPAWRSRSDRRGRDPGAQVVDRGGRRGRDVRRE